jgi:hypothetical protein
LALVTEPFCTYMEPLCHVSRGKIGEGDAGKPRQNIISLSAE